MAERQRKSGAKQPALEQALAEINDRLAGALEEPGAVVERPLVLIVGHQRAGTTLVYQYLVERFDVGYPSNLIARFWRAPVVGVRLQQSLAEQLPARPSSYRSHLGTTESLLGPHEFSYFWNYWWPTSRSCRDEAGLVCALANLERALDAPLVMKNVFNSLRVAELARILPTALFVRVRRDLLDLACSTLESRRRRFGADDAWFGVEPDERVALEALPPAEQIAGQLHHTERALAGDLARLPPARWIDLSYADFCADPVAATGALATVLPARAAVDLPAGFAATRPAAGHPDAAALRAALAAHFTADQIARGAR